jgi:Na+/H+-dicarboxylate symporter
MLPLAWWWGIATNGNILTITFFAICVGNCPLASSAQAYILQLSQAYILRVSSTQHPPSNVSIMLGPE